VTVLEGHPDNGVPAIVAASSLRCRRRRRRLCALRSAGRNARASRRPGFLDADARSARDLARRILAPRCGVQRRARRITRGRVRRAVRSIYCAARCTTGCTSRSGPRFVPGCRKCWRSKRRRCSASHSRGAGALGYRAHPRRLRCGRADAGDFCQAPAWPRACSSLAISCAGIEFERGEPQARAKGVPQWLASASVPRGMCSVANFSFLPLRYSSGRGRRGKKRSRIERTWTFWRTCRTPTPMKSSVRATGGASCRPRRTTIGRSLEATPQRLRAAFQRPAAYSGQCRSGRVSAPAKSSTSTRHRFRSQRAPPRRSRCYSVNVSYVS